MKRRIITVFVLVIVLSTNNTFAGTSPLDGLFEYLYANKLFNGVVLIANNNKVIYKKAFGYSNREWQVYNTVDTKFELGSISKQFTAAVIRRLASEGRIKLTDTISRYFPELSSSLTSNVTIEQLLNHTSGIPNYVRFQNFIPILSKILFSKTEYLDELNKHELLFTPGTSFHYSNTGYMLLGIIVEKVTSKSLIQAFKERIFDPLGMENTGAFDEEKVIPARAYGYERGSNNEYIIPGYMKKSEIILAEAGLYSTVDDLFRWYNAQQSGKISPFKNIENGFAFSENSGYINGNFYMVDKNPNSTIFHHEGSVPGSTALFMRVVEKNQCIVLLSNNGMAQENVLLTIANVIREYLNGQPIQIPKFDAYNSLIYSAIYCDASVVETQYECLKSNYRDIYNFDSGQISALSNILLSVFDLQQKAEQLIKLNKKLYPDE